jgi:UDP-N-acetylglucosamine 2-epimerase (non-hydrolysing)
LPEPEYNLRAGRGNHAGQIGRMLIGIENVLALQKPDLVLVQGDTNTAFAGALTAHWLGIRVGHIEAGLRSYDAQMPEEFNRVLTDHISDYLFAPTEISKKALLREGIDRKKIFVTGNTIVDAVFQNLKIAQKSRALLKNLGLKEKSYFIVTIHRIESVEKENICRKIFNFIEKIKREFGYDLIFPAHPRAKKSLRRFGIRLKNVRVIPPLDYLNFLQLENSARLIITDSGGVQEEACILGIPCVTVRERTERPETIEAGANILTGTGEEEIYNAVRKMLHRKRKWINPFGDGTGAEKITDVLDRL